MCVFKISDVQILLVLAKFKVFQNCVTIQSKVVAKTLFLFFLYRQRSFYLEFQRNCRPKHPDHGFMRVFRGVRGQKKAKKIIQEILRISKIPFKGIQIEAIRKNRQNTIFFSINLQRNCSLILGEKKRGKDFRLFFFDFFAFSNRFCQFNGKKVDFFFIDLSTKL